MADGGSADRQRALGGKSGSHPELTVFAYRRNPLAAAVLLPPPQPAYYRRYQPKKKKSVPTFFEAILALSKNSSFVLMCLAYIPIMVCARAVLGWCSGSARVVLGQCSGSARAVLGYSHGRCADAPGAHPNHGATGSC